MVARDDVVEPGEAQGVELHELDAKRTYRVVHVLIYRLIV